MYIRDCVICYIDLIYFVMSWSKINITLNISKNLITGMYERFVVGLR